MASENSEQKDRILDAILQHVLFDGWSETAIRRGAEDLGLTYEDIERQFPSGNRELIDYFVQRADRQMEEELEKRDIASMKIRDRITTAVRVRLEQSEPYKEAIRRAIIIQMLPQNAGTALKQLYRTVDAMWYSARDLSTDFNFYSKRMILAGVYSSTMMYWLDDSSEGHLKTWEFLDRRIENVMSFEKTKAKFKNNIGKKPDFSNFPSVSRFFRNLNTGRRAR
jgi:ubiquinone biosynthesis protein COQ9